MAPLNQTILEFAARRAVPPPMVDPATGGCALAIDGRYMVHLLERGDEAVAWVWLADLPDDEAALEAMLRRLLRAELGRFGQDDVVLSLDQAAGELRLHRRLALRALDPDGFEALLQSLVDGVEQRRAALGKRRSTRPIAPMVIRP